MVMANGGGNGAMVRMEVVILKSDKTVADESVNANTEFELIPSTACEDNEISKISNEMKEFHSKDESLSKLKSSDVFVNPQYGGVVDMQSELKLTSNQYSKFND